MVSWKEPAHRPRKDMGGQLQAPPHQCSPWVGTRSPLGCSSWARRSLRVLPAVNSSSLSGSFISTMPQVRALGPELLPVS